MNINVNSLNHDIYDCYYLAGAVSGECDSILTTDTDFLKLSQKLNDVYQYSLTYTNPIPKEILKDFSAFKM